jgi:chromatin remodeling complex protein RSC6
MATLKNSHTKDNKNKSKSKSNTMDEEETDNKVVPTETKNKKTKRELAELLSLNYSKDNELLMFESKKLKTDMLNLLRSYDTCIKKMKKNSDGFYKLLNKKKYKNKNKNKDKTNENKRSGFTKPCLVPKKIQLLLGLDENTELPRTKVTNLIYEYIKSNEL